MAGNLVEITVTATNDTEGGFAEAKAGAEETGDAYDENAAAADRDAEALKGQAAASDEAAAAAGRNADAQKGAAGASDEAAASAGKAADAQEDSSGKTDLAAASAGKGGHALRDLALGAGIAAAGALYLGIKFSQASTQLVTGAGQSAAGLKQVEQGMLAVSTQTGTSASDVQAGMYMIESAGFHGAAGLTVLKAAAEGAKVGNAQLGDVANVVTSALNAYHEPASKAVSVTNQLVATVAAGKMHMQDLATAISNVLPVAASAHISLAQVGGALATMTAQGMTARRASMNLANLIRALISPSATASAEMKSFGLNANKVAQDVGKEGLTGTLGTLTEAILRNSKGGQALAASFAGMTPASKQLAEGILAGKVSSEQLTDAEKNLTPQQAALVAAFAKTASSATGMKETYDAALKTMTGGATGLNSSLLLTGTHMSTFRRNVNSVADAARHAGPDVAHWGDVTKDTAFKLDQAKTGAENLGISVGMALLPAMNKILGPVTSFVSWIGKSKVAVDILAGALVSALAGYAVVKAVDAYKKLKETWGTVQQDAQKLATKLGILGGAQEEQAATADESAASSEALADAEGEQAVATEGAADAQEGLNLAMLANPITLIIGAIALLVVGFIELWTHCAAFRDFFKDAWRDIEHAVADAVDFIRSHWELILAILTGPVGLAVLFLKDHWKEIRHDVSAAWDDIRHTISHAWDEIGRTVDNGADKVIGFFKRMFDDLLAREISGLANIVHWFERLPGRVMNALSHLASDLFNLGKQAILGLVHGAESLLGDVAHIGSDVAHTLEGAFKDALGIFSPSTVMFAHGQNVAIGVAEGVIAATPRVIAAMNRMAMAMREAGEAAVRGLAAGMRSMTTELEYTVAQLGELADQALKDRLEISSPSKVFTRHGQAVSQGFAQGILSGLPSVTAAMYKLGTATGTGHGTAGAGSGGGWTELRVTGAGAANFMNVVRLIWPDLRLHVRAVGGGGPYSVQHALGETWPRGV